MDRVTSQGAKMNWTSCKPIISHSPQRAVANIWLTKEHQKEKSLGTTYRYFCLKRD